MSYKQEFPDYEGEFYCPEGWEDNSWHNDTCPRAMRICERDKHTIEFSVWNDFVDINKRESDKGKRYAFQIYVNDARNWESIFYYETDDIEEIKKLVKGVQI